MSGKPVEFSANAEPPGRKTNLCVNPAYRGRGRLGIYIPGVCLRNPIRSEVVRIDIPVQGVRGYGLVIWGTAQASTEDVVFDHEGGESEAAVFAMSGRLAHAVGAPRPLSVFVVELAPEAACQPILVRAEGRSDPTTERIMARPKLCNSG